MNLNDDFGALTGIEGGKQSIITAGLNWYVNTNIVSTASSKSRHFQPPPFRA
jgi:hypothetical protein